MWSKKNKLLINPKKCFVLPIYKGKIDFSNIPPLLIDDTQLTFVNKIKNLGYVLNSDLSCCDHISAVVQKIYFVLRNLRISAEYTPESIRLKLSKQLIFPILHYFANVYCKLDSNSLNKLTVAMNSVTRYVYGLNWDASISSWSKKLLGCNIENFSYIRSCIFLHKLLNCKQPKYLYDKIVFGFHQRNNKLLVPAYQYLNSSRLFFVNTIRIWNSLPDNIRNLQEESHFKQSVKNYFYNKR